MIECQLVCKAFDQGVPIFKDLNAAIDRGDFVFLTGKSGSGKTTLMRMIFGQARPDRGTIKVDGKDVSKMNQRQVAMLRRSMGVVFQDFKLIKDMTVFENVALPLRILGVAKYMIEHKVNLALSKVGLEGFSKTYPSSLSGGEKQRVAIARAVVNDPKILLADEPTGNLDPHLSREILDIFKSIHLRGTTIVMATHEHAFLDTIQARIFHLEDAKITHRNPAA